MKIRRTWSLYSMKVDSICARNYRLKKNSAFLWHVPHHSIRVQKLNELYRSGQRGTDIRGEEQIKKQRRRRKEGIKRRIKYEIKGKERRWKKRKGRLRTDVYKKHPCKKVSKSELVTFSSLRTGKKLKRRCKSLLLKSLWKEEKIAFPRYRHTCITIAGRLMAFW